MLRIDRHTSSTAAPTLDLLAENKRSIRVNLKSSSGIALVMRLAETADVLIDPFRPGVLEKLGLGPEVLCPKNPRLIYARMVGFRRDGKYKDMAGHDISMFNLQAHKRPADSSGRLHCRFRCFINAG